LILGVIVFADKKLETFFGKQTGVGDDVSYTKLLQLSLLLQAFIQELTLVALLKEAP
jgi:hypothetical protein